MLVSINCQSAVNLGAMMSRFRFSSSFEFVDAIAGLWGNDACNGAIAYRNYSKTLTFALLNVSFDLQRKRLPFLENRCVIAYNLIFPECITFYQFCHRENVIVATL